MAIAFAGAALLHPASVLPEAVLHGAQKLAGAVATVSFAVAALIDYDQ